nr:Smr/MutS family protein [Sphingomonas bacterium]
MAGRRLDAEEVALWRRVTAGVRPLTPAAPAPAPIARQVPEPPPQRVSQPPLPPVRAVARARAVPGETLDGGWDRRLSRGLVPPDRTIDLHGHTLVSAHHALDHALDRAAQDGTRLILLVTGRPPRADDRESDRPRRGAIRASIGDWLAGSVHSGRIAAVRNAHPRHGGAGALYVVLRRNRNGG